MTYATVFYGPLLFALGIPDTTDANTPDAVVPWNYALDAPPEKTPVNLAVERQPMPAHWDWPLNSPLKIHALARSFDWKPLARESLPAAGAVSGKAVSAIQVRKAMTLLPAEPVANSGPPETITLVPYGCTKFRLSMFPLTERARQAFVSE